MCGRIVISRHGADLVKMRVYSNQVMNNLGSYRAGYNIAPGNHIPGIFKQNNINNNHNSEIKINDDIKNEKSTNSKNKKEIINEEENLRKKSNYILESMKWGINTGKRENLLFNSRSDTINIYPFYKKYNRCIVIIEGYYEWKKIESANKKIKKQPYYISLKEKDKDNLIYLAGLYSNEIDNDGFEYKSVTIITCNANKEIDFIHDRMPVIFKNFNEAEKYLNGIQIQYFVNQIKDIKLDFYEVGDLVNNISNNTKDNIMPKEKIKYNKNRNLLINHFLKKSKSDNSFKLIKNETKIDQSTENKMKLKINYIDKINKRMNSSDNKNEAISDISTVDGLTEITKDIKVINKKKKKINDNEFMNKGKIKGQYIKEKSKKSVRKSKNNPFILDEELEKSQCKQINFMKNFLMNSTEKK